LLNLQKDKQG